ncbi:cytochrome oxidase small assembly protein [uncultured Comamonas sp.]
MITPVQRKANRRLAWILASIAVAFFIGFLVKMTVL